MYLQIAAASCWGAIPLADGPSAVQESWAARGGGPKVLTQGRVRYFFCVCLSIAIYLGGTFLVFHTGIGVAILNLAGLTAEPEYNNAMEALVLIGSGCFIVFVVAAVLWAAPADPFRKFLAMVSASAVLAFVYVMFRTFTGKIPYGRLGEPIIQACQHFILPVLITSFTAWVIGLTDSDNPQRARRPGPFDRPGDGQ